MAQCRVPDFAKMSKSRDDGSMTPSDHILDIKPCAFSWSDVALLSEQFEYDNPGRPSPLSHRCMMSGVHSEHVCECGSRYRDLREKRSRRPALVDWEKEGWA